MPHDINISVLVDEATGAVNINMPYEVEITQYDCCVQTLVFDRPSKYATADLILMFDNGIKRFRNQHLYGANRFEIVDALTQEKKLMLQIYYEFDNGDKTRYSNVLTFNLRKSLSVQAQAIIPLPDYPTVYTENNAIKVIRENASGQFEYFSPSVNDFVIISGGGGGGTARQRNMDGGGAATLYTAWQKADGGNAMSKYTGTQKIDGGGAIG